MPFTDAQVRRVIADTEIGGGAGYETDISGPADANVTVTSRAGLERHCGDAGKVIWIPGDVQIELTSTLAVRATIASDRGIDGSDGALIYTTQRGKTSAAWDGGIGRGLIHCYGTGRLTGLRLRGPYHNHYPNPEYPGYIPLDSGTPAERTRKREQRYARGVNIHSSGVEIDNIEIYGWPNQAINIGSARNAYSPYIHHIDGHDCMMVAAGYVVDVVRGTPRIEKCYFNAARHAVDGFGHENCGYVLESSVFGPSTYSHAVDMHCLGENGFSGNTDPNSPTWGLRGGGRMEIRDNVFLYRQDIRGNNQECIVIRGVPKDKCLVERNRFMHPVPPDRNPGNKSPGYAWRQVNVYSSTWGSVRLDAHGYTPNFIRRDNQFRQTSIRLPSNTRPPAGDTDTRRPLHHERDRNRAWSGSMREIETSLERVRHSISVDAEQ